MPIVMDIHFHKDYRCRIHTNEMLKAPQTDDNYDALTTGHLKQVHRILHLIAYHVLCLMNGGN